MAFNVVGLISIIFFYILILMVGMWAARKSKASADSEDVMLAGRNIGVLVGIFTMTGTFLNSTVMHIIRNLVY